MSHHRNLQWCLPSPPPSGIVDATSHQCLVSNCIKELRHCTVKSVLLQPESALQSVMGPISVYQCIATAEAAVQCIQWFPLAFCVHGNKFSIFIKDISSFGSEGINFIAKENKKQKQLEFSQEEMWGFKATESAAEEQMGVNWVFLILAWKWEALLLQSQEGLEKPNWNSGNIARFKVALDIFREDILWDQQSYIQSLHHFLESFAWGHFLADILATSLGACCQIWRC